MLRTEARALLADIVGTERDPLLVAIDLAANPDLPVQLRLEAALGSAKYLHPVLSAAAVAHVPATADHRLALDGLLDRLARLAPSGPLIEAASGGEHEAAALAGEPEAAE